MNVGWIHKFTEKLKVVALPHGRGIPDSIAQVPDRLECNYFLFVILLFLFENATGLFVDGLLWIARRFRRRVFTRSLKYEGVSLIAGLQRISRTKTKRYNIPFETGHKSDTILRYQAEDAMVKCHAFVAKQRNSPKKGRIVD